MSNQAMLETVQTKISSLILKDLGEEYIDDVRAIQATTSHGELVRTLIEDVGMDLKYVDHELSETEMEWLCPSAD